MAKIPHIRHDQIQYIHSVTHNNNQLAYCLIDFRQTVENVVSIII